MTKPPMHEGAAAPLRPTPPPPPPPEWHHDERGGLWPGRAAKTPPPETPAAMDVNQFVAAFHDALSGLYVGVSARSFTLSIRCTRCRSLVAKLPDPDAESDANIWPTVADLVDTSAQHITECPHFTRKGPA